MKLTIEAIRKFLSTYKRNTISNESLTRAGILIPIFEQNDELHVILTKRTEDVEHHKGQVSFPGGSMDKSDLSIIDTALRETKEEIGLEKRDVEILGLLDDFPTTSGFNITPVVALVKFPRNLKLNLKEVKEVFTVPLEFFLNIENEKIESYNQQGNKLSTYVYYYKDYRIWGITAKIINNFIKNFR